MSNKFVSLTSALALTVGVASADVPKVAVDIAPVHSLVSKVMNGLGKPNLIIPSEASPHEYQLKPSDAKAIQESKVIFWIGEDLTPWLEKSLETLPKDASITTLLEVDGIELLDFRESALFEAHDHSDHDDHDDHDDHGDDHDEHDHEEMFANLIHANYIQQDAEFTGYEIEIGKTFNLGSGELTLSFGRDDVEAEFSDGHNVPRINPARNIYTISYIENDWVFKVSLKDVEKQDDVGEGETVTDSYQTVSYTHLTLPTKRIV